MRARGTTRGVGTVEAVAIASLGASLLIVGVPAFTRELHASRQAEAALGLESISVAAVARATGAAPANALPASAPLSPSEVPRGIRVVDPEGTWTTEPWATLGFRPVAEGASHAYAFRLETHSQLQRSQLRALAHGDLDGDGVTSTFEVRVTADANGARVEPGMLVDEGLE